MKTKFFGTALLVGTLALCAQAQQQQSMNETNRQADIAADQSGTNNFRDAFTNGWQRAGSNMAQWGTNAYRGLTNAWTSLSNRFRARMQESEPTGGTNRVYANTNSTSTATNNGEMQEGNAGTTMLTSEDRAFSPEDRTLLATIRQEIQPILVTSGSTANVRFEAQKGIVTVLGVVPTPQESQRIAEVVQQTPGVFRVINQIKVNAQANANAALNAAGAMQSQVGSAVGTNATAFGSVQTNLGGTSLVSQAGLGTNNVNTNAFSAGTATNFNSSTNLSPTGRTNTSGRVMPDTNRDQNLPPGLRNRETLPPGVEKREQLPPGLQKREQSSDTNKTEDTSR